LRRTIATTQKIKKLFVSHFPSKQRALMKIDPSHIVENCLLVLTGEKNLKKNQQQRFLGGKTVLYPAVYPTAVKSVHYRLL
jgi:hypothetical protein